jgi:Zn-finger nucleic acid-binding protein
MVSAFNCPNCGASVSPDSPSSCTYCGSAIAVRACPSCFASVPVGMKRCPSCGAEAAGAGSNAASKKLQCPCCEADLAPMAAGKYVLQECAECGGLWLDTHTFQEICTHEEAQEAVLGSQTAYKTGSCSPGRKRRAYIPCPECKKLMNPKNFSSISGVVLDWCRNHGSWFDRGELQKIITFIKNGGLRKAREREMENLKDQQERLRVQKLEDTVRQSYIDSSMSVESKMEHNMAPNEDPFMRLFRMLSKLE